MKTTEKTLALVTGANSGIGFEWAAQLMEKGYFHVLVCSRSVDKGEAAVKDLRSRGYAGTCEMLQLDQTDDDSIAAAAKNVKETYGRLDLLLNNAGIGIGEVTRKNMADSFDTNATGVWFVTQAFADLLRKSITTARVINTSSIGASVALSLDPTSWVYSMQALPYRASKTALSMVTSQLAWEFKDDNIKVFSICPGFTASNISEQNKVEHGAKPTDVSVQQLMDIAIGERDTEATKFLHADGCYDW